MLEIVLIVLLIGVLIAVALMYLRVSAQARVLTQLSAQLDSSLEQKHRAMLLDLHNGLTQQGDRLGGQLTDNSDRLRGSVGAELKQTRDTLQGLQLALIQNMAQQSATLNDKLTETTRALNAKIDER